MATRSSACFNAFLAALPELLDRNLTTGATLLPLTLAVLIFCPSPPTSTHNDRYFWLHCYGQAGVPIPTSIGSGGATSNK